MPRSRSRLDALLMSLDCGTDATTLQSRVAVPASVSPVREKAERAMLERLRLLRRGASRRQM